MTITTAATSSMPANACSSDRLTAAATTKHTTISKEQLPIRGTWGMMRLRRCGGWLAGNIHCSEQVGRKGYSADTAHEVRHGVFHG